MRISRSLRDVAYKALQVKERLVNELSREPSLKEIAQEIQMPAEEIIFALDAIRDPVSLFEPIYNDGGDPIYVVDQISDDKNLDNGWVRKYSHQGGAG